MLKSIKKYTNYFCYLLKHKWYVFKFGIKFKVPIINLILHDLSKFLPSEFFPYADKFDKIELGEEDSELENRFTFAWNFHQKRNPHHHQYWVVQDNLGENFCIEMPEDYVREMVADWTAVQYFLTKETSVKDWYLKNRANMWLHYKTRELVCQLIGNNYSW